MKLQDAAKLLELSGLVTPEDVKKAYRRAAMKYHPDRTNASAEMMQMVNEAYDVLKAFSGELDQGEQEDYAGELLSALDAVIDLDGLIFEICGAWVWVTGETKKHAKKLGKKGAGFYYASKKKAWYYRPADHKSAARGSWSMDDIREVHGSKKVNAKKKQKLANA